MDLRLHGKVAIVTGGTANIGRAIALALADEGVKLVFTGRDKEAGARIADQARARGAADVLFIAADMLVKESALEIAEAAAALGPVEVLVNNVGGNVGAGFFVDSDPDTWDGDIDLNFGTMLRMTRAVLTGMVERRRGAIVNIGSTSGIAGDYMLPVYSAMKGAVHAFTRVLAKEVGQHDVRVNAVAPYGTMATEAEAFSSGSRFNPANDFFARSREGVAPADLAKRARPTALPRPMARPEEVASMAVWLASDQASFVTGQIMQVDGGALL